MATVAIVPQPRPLLGIDRRTGAFLELVPSASVPGLYHLVDPVRRECSCKGYSFRKNCRHLSPLAPSRPLADGGAAHLAVKRAAGEWPSAPAESATERRARLASEYTSIFGSDGEG